MQWWTTRQLKSGNASKRLKAVEKLAASPDAHNFEHFVAALADSDFEVQVIAAQALGRMGERAIEPLAMALKDKSSSVREATVRALDMIGGAQVVELLIAALKDENGDVRKTAVEAVARVGTTESKQALEECRRREEEAKRLAEEARAKRLAEEEKARRLAEEEKAKRRAQMPGIDDLISRLQNVHQKLKAMAWDNPNLQTVVDMIGAFPESLETGSSLDGRPLSNLEIGQALQVFAGMLIPFASRNPNLMSLWQELDSISRKVARL